MSEATIEASIQSTIQGLSAFDDVDVTISDFAILDNTLQRAPLVIIEVSDDFRAGDELGGCSVTEWFIPVLLIEKWEDDATTRLALRDRRQALIDEFVNDNRNVGTGAECNIIKNDGPITGYNPTRNAPNPLILYQRLIFEVTEEAV